MSLPTEAEVLEQYMTRLEAVTAPSSSEGETLEALAAMKEDLFHKTVVLRSAGREREAEAILRPLLGLFASPWAKVRKWVAGFAGELVALAPWWLTSRALLDALRMLLDDTNSAVAKTAVLSVTKLFTKALWLLCGNSESGADTRAAAMLDAAWWADFYKLADPVFKHGMSSSKDGLRIAALKFYEAFALACFSLPQKPEPALLAVIDDVNALTRRAMSHVEALCRMTSATTVTAMVLKVVIGLLLKIGLTHQHTHELVIGALVALASNTLRHIAKQQQASTKFLIKSALLKFLRKPETEPYHEDMVVALGRMDAHDPAENAIRTAERAMGRLSAFRKRQRDAAEAAQRAARKRQKTQALAAKLTKSLTDLAKLDPKLVGVISKCVEAAGGDPGRLVELLNAEGVDIAAVSDDLADMIAATEKATAVADMDVASASGELGASDPRRAEKAIPWADRLAKATAASPPAASLSLSQCLALYDAALARCTSSRAAVAAGGGNHIALGLIPHLGLLRTLVVIQDASLAAAPKTQAAEQALLSFLASELPQSMPTLVGWLHLAYANTAGLTPLQALPADAYDALLLRVIDTIGSLKTDVTSRMGHLAVVLANAPALPGSAVARISELTQPAPEHAADAATSVSSSMALWSELAVMRPSGAEPFVAHLLDAALSDRSDVREVAAATVASKLYSVGTHREIIEEFAKTAVASLAKLDPASLPEEQGAADNVIQTKLDLFLTLMGKKHELLHDFMTVYPGFAQDVKKHVHRQLVPVVQSMGSSSPVILKVVETHPEEAKILLLQILHALTDSAPPSRELVAAVLKVYNERERNVRLLIPILSGMSNAVLLEHVKDLIALPERTARFVVGKLVRTEGMALSPVDFLVHVHVLEPNPETLPRQRLQDVVSWVFADTTVTSDKLIAILVQRLMSHSVIPPMLMSTVSAIWRERPALSRFIMSQLGQLISSSKSSKKKVWKDAQIWQGFVDFILMARPQSLQLAFQLPVKPFAALLKRNPELLANLTAFANDQRGRIPRSHIEALQERAKKNRKKAKAAAAKAAQAAAMPQAE
ncbi:uncharacterized protein AMSG_04649 [Thecamonas trahens ATCC 50062]|uniref:Symplekin n=1 Tax=Thecamonas trahens ATCC 50062 TaxID=461836 RepID=A0A0L0D9I7_THETB|nr:hypothetical protein AMSG_04649 [Thecamonas trahens ATCC 50062]KNC48905.1 hypothetical protein AMSG_04649 [Thecamonas trahens ATCC 50062]|eukprot:XP_013758323.1 hypothetical protein AMSG_04649 [Thecamonas trahens ATCC 50062]